MRANDEKEPRLLNVTLPFSLDSLITHR